MPQGRTPHKYELIYEELRKQLTEGQYRDGQRLPSEMELSASYDVSRPTVTKALNALEAEGLITRKTGSGSYAQVQPEIQNNRLFGLIVPGLGRGEIFEPICARIASLAEPCNFSLLWSRAEPDVAAQPQTLEAITRRYIANQVAGVFFEPLELRPEYHEVNWNLIQLLKEAEIPVVLIDSDFLRFPERSQYDLVGLDNFRAGYSAAQHFIHHGARRVDFLARPYSADSVVSRQGGYLKALMDAGITPDTSWIHTGNPEDQDFVHRVIQESGASNIICENDETAAALMYALEREGIPVPEQVRFIGFDDVRYAQHLKIPLTTIKQPCEEIGALAVETMLWRVEHPDHPPRTLLASGTLIVRQSCGHGAEESRILAEEH